MEKNNNKVYLIIIVILLFIIGIGIGYIIGNNKSDLKVGEKEVNKKEEKEIDKNEEEPAKSEEKHHLGLHNMGFPFIDETVTHEVMLNDKKLGIRIEDKDGVEVFFYINNKKYMEWSPNAPGSYNYRVITGTDNKEYLFLSFGISEIGSAYIINDNGEEIFHISSDPVDIECSSYTDEDDLVYIEYSEGIDSVFYYKYVDGSKTSDWKIKLELVKLVINNNKVTEEKQNKTINGGLGQCV